MSVDVLAALAAASVPSPPAGAAAAFAAAAAAAPPAAFAVSTLPALLAGAADKKDAAKRRGAFECVAALAAAGAPGLAPALAAHVLPAALGALADAKDVSAAAAAAGAAVVKAAGPLAARSLLPVLFAALSPKHKWQTREGALKLLGALPASAPLQTRLALPLIIPAVSDLVNDARKEVAAAAEAALVDACAVVGNTDIEPFIKTLVSCIARPEELTECVYKLAATTFVQAVEPPTLAMVVPVLERGLKAAGLTALRTRRCASVIIDNMCKLVEVPAYVAPFLAKLLPGLDRVKEETADEEVRKVAAVAHATLTRAGGVDGGEGGSGAPPTALPADPAVLKAALSSALLQQGVGAASAPEAVEATAYAVNVAAALVDAREFGDAAWSAAVGAVLAPHYAAGSAKALAAAVDAFRVAAQATVVVAVKESDDDETGEVLCDCQFSLGYGAKILLNTATMKLRRGHRYGLVGTKGVGKSTLLRAIATGSVEGFPPQDVLRSVIVEHDIIGAAEDVDYSVIQYAMLDPRLTGFTEATVMAALKDVGFTDHFCKNSVTALSGGWKMKLALARALLLKPDIMLLDEPTNHLDKINAAWVVSTIKSLENVTSIIVAHDTGFLDTVCTDILHFNNLKLKRYKGNLTEFVKAVPEAKSFFTLDASNVRFSFPSPGHLEGVNSKGKAILKMQHVTYKYPTSDRWIVQDVTINVSLSSRVVVVGPNGAGKSTMIKLLTGEIANPASGTCWRHPNVRIAYVAQHAFHHIEQHLDKTPNEYMQWRYASGEDREAVAKESARISAEEEKKMAEKVQLDGASFVVEQVLARRQLKNSYEYEVSFVGKAASANKWLPRRWLEDHGFDKLVAQVDAREAAAAGLHSKPLTAANVAAHFAEVGLEPEYTLHARMRGLSGGQKVKVVLAAAMWHNPHMLVLDEPTNNLDRDSLGALAAAIKGFGGGVILITHNAEFANHICSEIWLVDAGKLNVSGESWTKDEKIVQQKEAEEVVDGAGNVIKVQQKAKELSKQEKKKVMKARLQRIKRGEDVDDEEPWMTEWMKEFGGEEA